MRLFGRIIAWALLVVIVLALFGGAGGYLWLRAALPQTSGSVQVQGIVAPVTITRDSDAVPHIRAQSEEDALFGLGYAHAQDRLWQMEFQRRIGQGRLSEVLGEATVETDKFLRTLGPARATERAWAAMSPEDRAPVEAYVRGINSFVSSHHDRQLPIEYTILGFSPEPWTPIDVLVWAKMMAYNLGGNWEHELLRVELTKKLGADKAAELMPPASPADPLILPEASERSSGAGQEPRSQGADADVASLIRSSASPLLDIHQEIQTSLGLGGTNIGSNNWVVGGSRTTTGKPLLADDPHLGAQVPSIWYLAHITGGAIDAIGATVPGLPGIVIGHNQRIAWGVTNTGPDVQDLFVERINDRDEVEYRGAMEPMQVIEDVIKVKNQPDIPLRIRITRHGPLISDVIEGSNEALAIRWTALDDTDTTFPAFLGINRAQTWPKFVDALEAYYAPMQNFVYADVDGNIGYYAPGKLPVRAQGDGTMPVPGWTGEYDWQGYVPHAELPHAFNPPEGFIASANNKVVGPEYPHLIGSSFAAPYRVQRIRELIEAKPLLSPDDIAAMHADVSSVQARELLPLLHAVEPQSERAKQALVLLENWDGTMDGDSAAAAVYAAWYQRIDDALIGDELGEELLDSYGGASSDFFAMFLPEVLTSEAGWCDDLTTGGRETCAAQLAVALEQGLDAMAAEQGTDDVAGWRWNRAHRAHFPHNPFDQVGALKRFFSRDIPNGGDKFTVNVAPVRAVDFDQRHVPSYRQIVDLSELDASRFMHTLGQSGHVISGNYANLLARWQEVEYLPMRFDEAEIQQGNRGTLTLTP